MSLIKWLEEEKLKKHESSRNEIVQLFKIVERDIDDAGIVQLSSDRRFITAYNAALQLTTIVLRAAGFRTNPNKAGHHRITIDALPEILGKNHQELSDYLHACRIKRNMSDYTNSGAVSAAEVAEIIKEVKALKELVKEWVKKKHPQLHD
ncbi:MAG: hypothetical protein ABSA17_02840 [Rhabdochlamydiaceae bacterium]|jgi:hypothetical protein